MNSWPEHEQLLNRFGEWLDATRAEFGELTDEDLAGVTAEVRTVGLYDLVEAFTALRQEVKLQTKSSRTVQNCADSAIASLETAIDRFNSVDAKELAAARSAAVPLVKTIAQLSESVERGRTVIERAAERIAEETRSRFLAWLDEETRREVWWRRRINRRFRRALEARWELQVRQIHQPLCESLLDGYRLIEQRLDRAMQENEIRRIDCVGRVVDPNCMTVVGLQEDSGRPKGIVVEEVRPGYYWRTEVVRFAEVRATSLPKE
jgi:molecular chaperone GrpE